MSRTLLLLLLGLLSSFRGAGAAEPVALPAPDRIRLAEAFALRDAVAEQVWPGWSRVPFAVLLVAPEYEYLVRHPRPSADFQPLGYDSLLQSPVYYRARTFAPQLQATFPAVGGLSTVVIGQAEHTQSRRSTPWVVTLLHEHFHQLQNAQPDYFSGVAALNLAGGDQTGMWMLNYPFPYAQPAPAQAFDQLTRTLLAALAAPAGARQARQAAGYQRAKAQLRQLVSPADYRYFSFQLWQEGLARYTEYRVAQAAAGYQPTAAFRALPDYEPYALQAAALRATALQELQTARLGQRQRVAFYPLGLAEALLLDQVSPGWQGRYFTQMFSTDAYFRR